jgi:hypothetical protein
MTDEQIEKIAKKVEHDLAVKEASEQFEKSFRQRSFSGRNPELGPMIKCAECGRRHRDNERHDAIRYAINAETGEVMTAKTKHLRVPADPYWRPKRGIFVWFNTLNKFVKLD